MAIQMTRAEYEAKYGVKPVLSSTQTPTSAVKPTTPNAPVQMTRAQYEAKYGVAPQVSTPAVAPKQTVMQKAGSVFNSLFPGQKTGEAIASSQVKSKIKSGTAGIQEVDYSKISPEARVRLEKKGVPTTIEAQRAETAGTVETPTTAEVAGDIASAALAVVPVTKGLSLAKTVGLGYAGDVANNLASGEKGAKVLTPGVGAGISVVPGVSKFIKNAKPAKAVSDVIEKTKTPVNKATSVISNILKTAGEKTGVSGRIAKDNVSPFLQTEFEAPKVKSQAKKAVSQQRIEKEYSKYNTQSVKSQNSAYEKNPVDKFIVPKVVKQVETKIIPARKKAGQIMGEEMKRLGGTTVDLTERAKKLETDLRDRANLILKKGKLVSLTKQSKLDASDKLFVNNYLKQTKKLGVNPTAADVEAFEFRNRSIIDKALNGGTIDRNVASIIKNHASSLLEEFNPKRNPAFKKYAEARAKYKDLSTFLEEADKALGDDSVLGNPTRLTSALKSAVQSIHSTGKKDWLIKLENLTGYKALQDSVTAFQAMKDAGDFKGRSLLDVFTENEMGGRRALLNKMGTAGVVVDALMEKGKDVISGSKTEQTLRYFKNQRIPSRTIKGNKVEFRKPFTSNKSTVGESVKITPKKTPTPTVKKTNNIKRYTK